MSSCESVPQASLFNDLEKEIAAIRKSIESIDTLLKSRQSIEELTKKDPKDNRKQLKYTAEELESLRQQLLKVISDYETPRDGSGKKTVTKGQSKYQPKPVHNAVRRGISTGPEQLPGSRTSNQYVSGNDNEGSKHHTPDVLPKVHGQKPNANVKSKSSKKEDVGKDNELELKIMHMESGNKDREKDECNGGISKQNQPTDCYDNVKHRNETEIKELKEWYDREKRRYETEIKGLYDRYDIEKEGYTTEMKKLSDRHNKEKHRLETEIKELKDQHKAENDIYETQIQQLRSRHEDECRKYEKQKQEIERLTAENKDLSSRFGKLAEEKLTQDNPNVADLSDALRATVIAEKYNQLYGKPWTTAFRDIRKLKGRNYEKQIIQDLLDNLKDVFDYCLKLAKEQEDRLKNIFQCPVQTMGGKQQVRVPEINGRQLQVLLDLRKQIAATAIKDVTEGYHVKQKSEQCETKDEDSSKTVAEIKKVYCQKCVEVCWPMVLHNPQLSIETDVKADDPVDMNTFNLRSAGDCIEMVVLPPLFLGKGGPLLARGVLEGRNSTTKLQLL